MAGSSNNRVALSPPVIEPTPIPVLPASVMIPQHSIPSLPMQVQAALAQGVNPCDLGLCADQISTVQMGSATPILMGESATATQAGMPVDSFAARRVLRGADARAGLPVAQTMAGMNQDWNTVAIQELQSTPEWAAYLQELTPIYGDAAAAVATRNFAQASGMAGAYQGSAQMPGDTAQRQQAAGRLQAMGLAAGDTSAAAQAFGIDPGGFNAGLTFIDPTTGAVGNYVGGAMVDPNMTALTAGGAVPNPLNPLTANLLGLPGYVAAQQMIPQAMAKAAPKVAAQAQKQADTMTQIAAKSAAGLARQKEVTKSFKETAELRAAAAARLQAERLADAAKRDELRIAARYKTTPAPSGAASGAKSY